MKQRVLLAEDDEDFRTLLREAIEDRFNVSVVEAGDGRKALEMMSSGEKIDVLVSDFKMPHLSGFELVKRIRENGFQGNVLFITGLDREELVRNGFNLGALDFFRKPVDEGFFEALDNALSMARLKWSIPSRGSTPSP